MFPELSTFSLSDGISAIVALIMVLLSAGGIIWVGRELINFMQGKYTDSILGPNHCVDDDEWGDYYDAGYLTDEQYEAGPDEFFK